MAKNTVYFVYIVPHWGRSGISVAKKWIGLSEDGMSVNLKHISQFPFPIPDYYNEMWAKANAEKIKTAAILDTETSGKNCEIDEIIEIGIRLVDFNKETGEILKFGDSYCERQEPKNPISDEIATITGLTMEDLIGHAIDWAKVDEMLSEVVLVIAHNAKFDRAFIDRKSKVSQRTIWACSFQYVDWMKKGFTAGKLELLNIWHGFFTGSHRALNDCDALAYLLTFEHEGKTYLAEILENARSPQAKVMATASPFESKDVLKARNYQWDNTNKFWAKVIKQSDAAEENRWLEENVYCGKSRATIIVVRPEDSFKE